MMSCRSLTSWGRRALQARPSTVLSDVPVCRSISSTSLVRAGKPPVQDLPERTVYDDFNNILAHTDQPRLQINNLTSHGLLLSDGLQITGPCLILGGQIYLWDVPPVKGLAGDATNRGDNWSKWSEAGAEAIFKCLEVVSPRPDILLFGTGATILPLLPAIKRHITRLGIQVDVMDSRNAGSTYNLLAEEGRRVAAAIMPVNYVSSRTGRS